MKFRHWVASCSSRHALVDSSSLLFLFLLLAFTSTSDAKPLEFYEDRAPKSFKGELQGNKSKHLRNSSIQEQKSDSYIAVENGVEKPNLAVAEQSSEALSLDMSRPHSSTGAGLEEEKSSHDVVVAVESSPKESNVVASAPEHNDCGKQEVRVAPFFLVWFGIVLCFVLNDQLIFGECLFITNP